MGCWWLSDRNLAYNAGNLDSNPVGIPGQQPYLLESSLLDRIFLTPDAADVQLKQQPVRRKEKLTSNFT